MFLPVTLVMEYTCEDGTQTHTHTHTHMLRLSVVGGDGGVGGSPLPTFCYARPSSPPVVTELTKSAGGRSCQQNRLDVETLTREQAVIVASRGRLVSSIGGFLRGIVFLTTVMGGATSWQGPG